MGDDTAIGWQEATARLTAEKERAEAATRIVKRFGDPAEHASAEITYAEGKAESDAVVAALAVALARREPPESLESLQQRLAQAVAARATLTTLARDQIGAAAAREGAKDLDWAAVTAVAANLLPALEAAVAALWNRREEADALTRKTIATQLEAARWADFASLEAP